MYNLLYICIYIYSNSNYIQIQSDIEKKQNLNLELDKSLNWICLPIGDNHFNACNLASVSPSLIFFLLPHTKGNNRLPFGNREKKGFQSHQKPLKHIYICL